MKSISVNVTGKVQGVWFRDFVRKNAIKLELIGWVRNEPDGSVQAFAEGDVTMLEELIRHIKNGSPMSRVEDVVVKWEPCENKSKSFEITH